MKILVTGGAGFIGSNVADAYIKEGHEVVIVDNLSTGRKANINSKTRFYEMDIGSSDIASLIKTERFDIINHHAAQISVTVSVKAPVFDVEVNVIGFLNIMEAAVRADTSKIIFASTGGTIYGEADEYPTSESYHTMPLSPYAINKYASEKYLVYYSHQYGLDFTVLRYANIYGPRQIPHGESAAVAIFMNNITTGKESTLYHFEGETSGMSRDYTFVGDVVKANLLAVKGGSREIFNVGTGTATTTGKLYSIILEATKKRISDLPPELGSPAMDTSRPGEIRRSCLSVEKAHCVLDFSAQTELIEGVELTLDWFMHSKNRILQNNT